MNREFFLELARAEHKVPLGADIVLREKPDHEAILSDPTRLGQLLAETAQRFRTPLAIPHMDLELEKHVLTRLIGVPPDKLSTFHFDEPPGQPEFDAVKQGLEQPFGPRMEANIGAVRWIADNTDLFPIGMSIGPFSLMSKFISDPIAPLYLAGAGATAEEDDEVATVEATLELGLLVILKSIERQLQAGAKAIFIAEPAANVVYISPKQIEVGSDVFDRYAIAPNRRIAELIASYDADLIFHCCGELTDTMVRKFGDLRPAMLSLGSSRNLWEDARLIDKDIVLYGNLPSKRFYSDSLISVADVSRMAVEYRQKMRETGHPYILGSECDVLSVPGCENSIRAKVEAIVGA